MKKYENIYNHFVKLIINGDYTTGSILPTENTISLNFECSRVTVRKALAELERDGYISKKQGSGSIVIKNAARNKIVLLILPDVFKYIFIDLIQGIESTLRQKNISLFIANSFSDKSIERTVIKNHIDMVDAIIIEPTQVKNTCYLGSKTYSKLLEKPAICINTRIEELDLPYLIIDDKAAMTNIASHILALDKKRVLLFYKTDDLQGYQRLSGIKQVFDASTINYKSIEFDSTNIDKKFADLSFLYFHFKPDCIMFYNDEYAYKFMSTYNINPIVDNILITGFDNTEFSNGHPYRFISPNHPKGQMGIDAANMIIKLLDGESVESIVYPPDIDFNK